MPLSAKENNLLKQLVEGSTPQKRKEALDSLKVIEGNTVYERLLTPSESEGYVTARRNAASDDNSERQMHRIVDTARARAKAILGE